MIIFLIILKFLLFNHSIVYVAVSSGLVSIYIYVLYIPNIYVQLYICSIIFKWVGATTYYRGMGGQWMANDWPLITY